MIRTVINLPVLLATAAILFTSSFACGQTTPSLGAARNFALLGGSTVTVAAINTIVTGEVGTYPGTSITGIPAGGTVVPPFTTHSANSASMDAQASATALYIELATTGEAMPITAELGGTTRTPGTYSFSSSANIAAGTTLTLSGEGIYIFKVGSAITANVLSNVLLIDGAKPCGVFWQVTSAATLNGVYFAGTVVAQAAITLGVNAVLEGRALATTAGAVTLAGNNWVSCDNICLSGAFAEASTFGVGSAAPGLPALDFVPTSLPKLGSLATAVINNCPTVQAGVTLGFDSLENNPMDLGFAGMPGSFLWHSNDVIDFHADPSASLTSLSATSIQMQFKIPNDCRWFGRIYYLQAYCFAPGANAGNLIVSNAIKYTLGL
jgi:hypothetical protein